MDTVHGGLLSYLLVAWGVITTVLILLLIYRSIVGSKEEDQLFLDRSEEHLAREQREILARISRLTRPILVLAVISGVLLLVIAGLWVSDVLKRF